MKLTLTKQCSCNTALQPLWWLCRCLNQWRAARQSTQACGLSLDLTPLCQNERSNNPLGADFDYVAACPIDLRR